MKNTPEFEVGSNISELKHEREVEIEKLIENPELVIREFVDNHLNNTQLEGWEARLQLNIKKRLANDPDKRYLLALRQAATSLTDEKEKIITAAFLYDLEHRNEIEEVPSYNLKVLFRLVLSYAKEQEGLLGVAMNKYMETVSIEELNKIFKNGKGVKLQEDLPRVAEVALSRLSIEPEAAKEVLETTLNELFKPIINSKNKELKVESFFEYSYPYSYNNGIINAERFTPEVLEYLITEVKKRDPSFFINLINKIDRKISEDILNEKKVTISLHKIVNSSPILNEAYMELLDKKRIEEEEKNKQEAEKQAKLSIELEQENSRKDKEREILFQEKIAKEREQSNQECDKFLAEIEHFVIDDLIIDEQIKIKVQNSDLDKLGGLWNTGNWEILRNGEETIPLQLSSLSGKFMQLLQSRADQAKKTLLESVWDKKESELNASIRTALETKRNEIYKAIETRFSFDKSEPTIDDYKEYLDKLNDLLEKNESNNRFNRDEGSQQFLDDIKEIIQRKISEVLPFYENLKSEVEGNERNEEMISTQQEYLLKQVEEQTDYLQDIYAIGTGLSLRYLESRASNYSGSSIGSVSMGMGQGLSLSHQVKLEQKLEIHVDDEDSLTLEMGEDLASIKKRMAMVNWVAPHEIAHLVDLSSDMSKKLFPAEELIPMRSLVSDWKGGNKDLAEKMIPMIIKETTIDAVGYRMLKEYGTTNPFDESKTDRVTAALRGYIATVDVLKNIIQTNAETVEMKSRYSAIILRQIAGGEILTEEARNNEVSSQVITETEEILEKIRTVFNEFNQETNFIEKSQVEEIIELCKVYFKKAEQVSITREK